MESVGGDVLSDPLINAALQMALENPKLNSDLIKAFSEGADTDDIDRALKGRPSSEDQKELTAYVEARNRVASHVQRSMDGILTAMSDQWKRWLQISSIFLSSVFIFGAVLAHGSIKSGGDIILWFMVALGGGLLAPGINDFAKTLTSMGRGRRA